MIIIVVNFSHSHCRIAARSIVWNGTESDAWMMLSIVWLFAYVLVALPPPAPAPAPASLPCAMPIVCLANHKAFSDPAPAPAPCSCSSLSGCYFNQQQSAGCRSMWSPSRSCPIIAVPAAAAYTKPQQEQPQQRTQQ